MNAPQARRFILPLLTLAAFLLVAWIMVLNRPTAERASGPRGPGLTVDTLTIAPTDYAIHIPSYGTVQPRTRSNLVSQVGGEVIWVNPLFRDGGVFKAGDELLRIDDRDYKADLQIARAALYEARQTLAEEQAQSQQALADWGRLGDGGEADPLVLRKPQLLAAEARVASAEAALSKAQLALERTRIVTPFDGRILSTAVDLGEVINSNSQLATVYATDYVEIRLPLANADLHFVDLPEPRHDGESSATVPVQIQSSLSGDTTWQGKLVRTEGAIDDASRQLHAVAQIDDPFLLQQGADSVRDRKPLKIGEYVTAVIEGRHLNEVIVIPNSTIYQSSYAYVVDGGVLQRRELEIAWQNASEAVVSAGLEPGDALVTTTLGQVTSGTRVAIAGEAEVADLATEADAQAEARQ